MTAGQNDTVRRVNGGDTVLGGNSGIWSANLGMGALRAEMNGRIILVRSYETLQKSTLPGLTINKDYCCLFMGGRGIVLVSQMKVYYGMGATKDLVMLERIGFSFTELTTGTPELIYERNMLVSTTFDSIRVAMIAAHLPVTVLMGTAYLTSIDGYNTAAPGYRDGEAITVAATEQIALECSILTNENIPTMKNFAFGYKEGNALFVSTLDNAYKPRGTAKSKESMHIHVTDRDTGIDLPNSEISRIASDTSIQKMVTGPKGIGVFSSQATDSYDFLIKRPGFFDKWIYNKGYTAGTLIKFDVIMVKLPPTPPPSDTLAPPESSVQSATTDSAPTDAVIPDTTKPSSATLNPAIPPPTTKPPTV